MGEYKLCSLLLCIGLVIASVGVLPCGHCYGAFTGTPACKHAMQRNLRDLLLGPEAHGLCVLNSLRAAHIAGMVCDVVDRICIRKLDPAFKCTAHPQSIGPQGWNPDRMVQCLMILMCVSHDIFALGYKIPCEPDCSYLSPTE